MGKKGACSGRGLTGPTTWRVKEGPGSSTSGPTGNDWLDLTTAHPIQIGQEVTAIGAFSEHRGETFQPVISVFSDGDVVGLELLEDLPEHY